MPTLPEIRIPMPEEENKTLYGYITNSGEPPKFDDIRNSNLSPEEKVRQIQYRTQAYQDDVDRQLHKDYARMGAGTALSAASFHPFFNIPYVGTGIGGAMYDLGQGIVEGDTAGDLAKRAGRGFVIGETIGAIPYAGKALGKTKAGQAVINSAPVQAVGNVLNKAGEKFANTKLYDTLMTDIKAFNPNKQTVYHGSPYDFNKFSNEAIGTGEGAQAHGYGHYAALSKDVADTRYANMGYRGAGLSSETESLMRYGSLEDVKNELKNKISYYQKIKNDLNPTQKKWWEEQNKKIEKDLEFLKKNNVSKQLYKLSVPKDDVMLREGATFAQQPKKVQGAIKSIVKENPELAEVIDTRTADEFFEIAQKKLGKKGKNIMKEVFDAELSGDENKIINAWNKYNEFESKNPNITRTDFDPNEIYGYLKNYRNNGVDETGQLFQNQYSNTNLYKYLEDERNFNKALYDKGIKGISYNGGIDGEARVIFNPNDIVIGRKYYNQPNLYEQLTGKQNTGALVDALFNR